MRAAPCGSVWLRVVTGGSRYNPAMHTASELVRKSASTKILYMRCVVNPTNQSNTQSNVPGVSVCLVVVSVMRRSSTRMRMVKVIYATCSGGKYARGDARGCGWFSV